MTHWAEPIVFKEILEWLQKFRWIPQLFYLWGINYHNYTLLKKSINDYKQSFTCEEIDIIIRSWWWDPNIAYKIVKLLRRSFKKINFIVIWWTKSAATLIVLSWDEIIFWPEWELWPLDMQVWRESTHSPTFIQDSALIDSEALHNIEENSQKLFLEYYSLLYRSKMVKIDAKDISSQIFNYIANLYKPLIEQLDVFQISKMKRSLNVWAWYAERVLKTPKKDPDWKEQLHNRDNIRDLIEHLVNQCPDHGYNIDQWVLSTYLTNTKESIELDWSEIYSWLLSKIADYLFQFTWDDLRYVYLFDKNVWDVSNTTQESWDNSWKDSEQVSSESNSN